MTLSSITAITQEGQPSGLSSFIRSGVMYVFWQAPVSDTGLQRLNWKPHTAADFTEVTPTLAQAFHNVTALYHPASDQVVVVWDDALAVSGYTDGSLSTARFNALTGALVSGPTVLFSGSQPKLSYRTTASSECSLYYVTLKNGGVYGRLSTDGGVTWQSGEPIITGQVSSSQRIEVVPYDSEHVAIAQLGSDTRPMAEIGMLQRTRPISSIVKHPTVAGQFFIGEPSKFDNTTLIDNLRGGLVLATDNSKLFHLDGVVQGTSDTFGAVALLTVTGTAVAVTASAGPTGNGDDINSYTLTPVAGALNVDLPGASFAVALGVSSTHGYIAEYADNSGVLGQLIVVDLSSGTTATVFTGVTGVRAVAVANFLATPLIFVASTESGFERLRVYSQLALTPTLLLNTKLPARANSITVTVHPTNPTSVRVLVSMVDRFNIYDYNSAATPVLLVDSYQFQSIGQFFKSVVTSTGTVVLAAGRAGVVVLGPTGKTKAQIQVSGKPVATWVPSTAVSLNQLAQPRAQHQFYRGRFYFKCTTAGTTGAAEPSWASTGTMLDATAQWQPVAVIDGVVTDVAVDETTQRIYAVGVVGGDLGTDGRVWVLGAGRLL